jgi:hypothetical protein
MPKKNHCKNCNHIKGQHFTDVPNGKTKRFRSTGAIRIGGECMIVTCTCTTFISSLEDRNEKETNKN